MGNYLSRREGRKKRIPEEGWGKGAATCLWFCPPRASTAKRPRSTFFSGAPALVPGHLEAVRGHFRP